AVESRKSAAQEDDRSLDEALELRRTHLTFALQSRTRSVRAAWSWRSGGRTGTSRRANDRHARRAARRTKRGARSEGTSGNTRSVTCTGNVLSSSGRLACATLARSPLRLRPAPARR